MSKRAIMAAAKRAGVTIVDAWYGWHPTPGESVPGWAITFGPELDGEFMEFNNAAEAAEWIDENAAEMKESLEAEGPNGECCAHYAKTRRHGAFCRVTAALIAAAAKPAGEG